MPGATIFVKFDDVEFEVDSKLTEPEIRASLMKRYPAIAKAVTEIDPVTGDITYVAAAADKS